MKERPIILGPDAVRLFLNGTKTHYRMPVDRDMRIDHLSDIKYFLDGVTDSYGRYFRYPFGTVGDRVWVREPFRIETIKYKADGDTTAPHYAIGGWLGPVNMPRWASRLTMDIRGVWIEALQDMTEADMAAEGSDLFDFPAYWNRKVTDKSNCYGHNPYVWGYELEIV